LISKLKEKHAGLPRKVVVITSSPQKVISLMDILRRSLAASSLLLVLRLHRAERKWCQKVLLRNDLTHGLEKPAEV
jgi:hypothetical protein